MSTQAAGQDIMSILRMFTSPRMGPFENTNAPSPQPPAPNSDAARAISDPARYGGPEQAAAVATDPKSAKPEPVGRRVVPDPETTGSVPKGPGPTAPPAAAAASTPPSPPGAIPQGGTVGTPGYMSSNEVYQTWIAQQARARKEAERLQSIGLFSSGLAGLATSLSGGRIQESGGGGDIAIPGSTTATGSTLLPIDQMQKFYDADVAAKNLAADNARIDRLVQDPRMAAAGVTKDVLLTMRANSPAALAALLKDYFDGATETKTLADGTIVSRPLHGPANAPFVPVQQDELAKAKAAAALAKERQGLVGGGLKDPTTLALIASSEGHPNDPIYIKTLSDLSLEELQKRFTTATGGGGGGGGWGESYRKRIEAESEKGGLAITAAQTQADLLYRLQSGQGWTGPILGSDKVRWLAKIASDLNVPGADLLNEKSSESEVNIMLARVNQAAKGKAFPGAVSDYEQKILEGLVGADQTAQRDALVLIQRKLLTRSIADAVKASGVLTKGKQDLKDVPFAASAIADLNVPDYTNEIFLPAQGGQPAEIDQILHAKQVLDSNPGSAEAKKYYDGVRAGVEKSYGPGMFDYAIAKRGTP